MKFKKGDIVRQDRLYGRFDEFGVIGPLDYSGILGIIVDPKDPGPPFGPAYLDPPDWEAWSERNKITCVWWFQGAIGPGTKRDDPKFQRFSDLRLLDRAQ